ncbi:MAG TPA: alpha-1,2-fucosyltransferase [Puia sp.]|nr:alpha-1,2-fucosyltransferase [Puia sp.]
MVTCKLFGRYGNQLAQVSATIAYAYKHKMNYAFPSETTIKTIWPKTYFSTEPKEFPSGIHQVAWQPIGNVFSEAENQAYREIPYYHDVCLNGHFQCYQYFEEYIRPIHHALGFKWYSEAGFVSIHVRRTDYVDQVYRHPVITNEYLAAAIGYMQENGFKDFAVFSDDLPWCEANINEERYPGAKFEYEPSGNDPAKSFQLMSCCHHNITCNSSYSKMAAHFNFHEDKIVIAPKLWTNMPPNLWDTSGYLPPQWITF